MNNKITKLLENPLTKLMLLSIRGLIVISDPISRRIERHSLTSHVYGNVQDFCDCEECMEWKSETIGGK